MDRKNFFRNSFFALMALAISKLNFLKAANTGVCDLYFLTSDQVLSEANIEDAEWWQSLVDNTNKNK